MALRPSDRGGQRPHHLAAAGPHPDVVAAGFAVVAAAVLGLAIYVGSRGLLGFDAALVGYATATVFLAFGVTYRYLLWVRSPPARRYLMRGWQAFFSWRNFVRLPMVVPRALVSYLSFQTFLRSRSKPRWLAHQAVFWGVVLATLTTFPLTFGWVWFRASDAAGHRYVTYLWGFATVRFNPQSWSGWLVFHNLDVAAVLVLAGCAYFLWRRFRDREATTGQRLGYDFVPLVALVAISVTGLLLTFSSELLSGRDYDFLAIVHMTVVVLTLVYIPFGKFFHVIQRPASVGVEVYKRAAVERGGLFACRSCGQPVEAALFVADLQTTMGELGLEYPELVELCPRCKRVDRAAAYLEQVKGGFR
jgi:hypothetical protein